MLFLVPTTYVFMKNWRSFKEYLIIILGKYFLPLQKNICSGYALEQSLRKLQDCLTKPANFHSVLQKSSVCLTNVLWFLAKPDRQASCPAELYFVLPKISVCLTAVLHLLERFHEDWLEVPQCLREAFLTSIHNIRFKGELVKIIPELSLNTLP